jgi:hypothetical protein
MYVTKLKPILMAMVSLLLLGEIVSAQDEPKLPSGVAMVDVADYKDCFELKNETMRVVLCHQRGGRVLVYERDGANVLYLKDESGWDPNANGIARQLSAGRFDVGPEQLQVRGDDLWLGQWEAKATGDREVKMSSIVDSKSGLQVVRKFTLHETTSRLTITQTVTNEGDELVRQCFWSRTLAVHGGVTVVPCDSNRSLMPNLYCMAPNGKTLNFRPDDPAIRRIDDYLVIDGPPEHAKLGMDSVKGWVAYQTRSDQLFVKRYPVLDIGQYGELAGYNLSIWYPKESFMPACEVEPIGPMKTLRPRESDSFTVDWWLLPREFPADCKVNPKAVEELVVQKCVVE